MRKSDKRGLTTMELMKKIMRNTKIKSQKKNKNFYKMTGEYGVCYFPEDEYSPLMFHNETSGISMIAMSKYHSRKKARRVQKRLNRYHAELGQAYIYNFNTGYVTTR